MSKHTYRKCVVCGARVTNRNPKTTTCDPTCTNAKHAGWTREKQISHEMSEAIDRRSMATSFMEIEDCDGDSLD